MTTRTNIKAILCSSIVLLLGSCGPTNVQTDPAAIAKYKAAEPNVAEINQTIATLAMSMGSSATDYQIGPEDLVQITMYNVPDGEGRATPRTLSVRVSHEGKISLPLIGEISVSGLTISGLEKELATQYAKYIRNPQVGILITEYRQRVSVIGAVQKSAVFELTGPKTVIDVLAMAGGVTDRAGTQVHIYRQGPKGRESYVIDLMVLASNASLITADNAGLITMPVQAGDVINVPLAGTFFVDGAVRKAGPYPLGRRYSLTQALVTAGGVDPELNSSEITIFRRKGTSGMQQIAVDLDAVTAGTAPDPQIEADDVILVAMSGAKYFVKRFVGTIVSGLSVGSFVHGS
jgi:polysaccharide export outer membrane protein